MKMMRALLVVAAAAATCGTAYAQGGWDTIGTRDVGWNNDRDTIPVRGAARYRQIRLCAFGGPVHMMDLDVRFANGGHQDVNVRSLIRAGSCTRNIDLNGQDRNMTSISVLYERARLRWRRNPQVRVQAR